MKTFIRIQSRYFEIDSSRYRLAISDQTIIPSLQNQSSKDFTVVLDQCPMDPIWTKRRNSFSSCGVPMTDWYDHKPEYPFLEITVGDDDFLVPSFVEVLQRVPQQTENTELLAEHGYLWADGKVYEWSGSHKVIEAIQWIDDRECVRGIVVSNRPGWVHCRHQMNASLPESCDKVLPQGLKMAGWNPNLLDRICRMKIVQASAQGCELHPMRSKSVVFAEGSSRRRRKGKRG